MKNRLSLIIVIVIFTWATGAAAQSAGEHFHPKGKLPSDHTKKILRDGRIVFTAIDTAT